MLPDGISHPARRRPDVAHRSHPRLTELESRADAGAPIIDCHDRTHDYLRIAVTDRCNLRCRYCMPQEPEACRTEREMLTFDEIVRITRIMARMGVRKVRLTGGEPLMRPGLPQLVERIARIEGVSTVGLTTNGVLLQRHAGALKRAGLHALNISLDTLRPERFFGLTQHDDFAAVMAAIDEALERGFHPLKLNVVVIRGVNDDELPDFARMARDRPVNVRFIEYMPFDSNGWTEAGFLPYREMRRRLEAEFPLQAAPGSDPHAVAKDFAIDGYAGRVSFISPMSQHFCGGCNRIRMTAEGALKPCLFSAKETDLRGILRGDDSEARIETAVRDAMAGKWYSHPAVDALRGMINRSMIRIGG